MNAAIRAAVRRTPNVRQMSGSAKLVSDTKNTMIVASVLGLLGGLAWKYGITQPRKREIDNFYANLEKGKTA
eukprot:g3718.t1